MQNQQTGSWKNRIVMIGDAPRGTDVGDKNAHMEDAERTAQIFEMLLGDNLAGRKEHIADNGYMYIDMLDLS